MTKRAAIHAVLILGLAMPLVAGPPGQLPSSYVIEDLGTLPGYASADIWNGNYQNDRGDVALAVFNDPQGTDDRACLWTERLGLQPFPLPPNARLSRPWGLNNHREAAGWVDFTDGNRLAVLWDRSGWHLLDTPAGSWSWAFDINDHGDACGSYHAAGTPDNPQTAAVWTRRGRVDLPTLPGRNSCTAMGLNNFGEVTGGCFIAGDSSTYLPVLWKDGTVTQLENDGSGVGLSIGDDGAVVGMNDPHGALWANGTVTDLTPDMDWSWVGTLNRDHRVALQACDPGGCYAMIWQDGVLDNLQDRLPADSGWTLWWAFGVNDKGQVTGTGLHDGNMRVFRMTPAR